MRNVITVKLEDVQMIRGSDIVDYWKLSLVLIKTGEGDEFITHADEYFYWMDALANDDAINIEVEPCYMNRRYYWAHANTDDGLA